MKLGLPGSRKRSLDAEVATLSQRQKRDDDWKSTYDVTGTLTACLEAQNLPEYQAAVTGHVDHFESQTADQGWGCGWRNLQMMASFLLHHDEASSEALFKGCGFIPDVLTLQAWLECAWRAGIDTAGGDLFGNTMQGSSQWIGATEAATVLRLFGFKAQVVDFTGGLKNPNIQADKHGNDLHMGVECDHCHMYPIVGPRYNSQVVNDCDLCTECHDLPECGALAPFRVIQKISAPHGKAAGRTMDSRLADKNQHNTPPHHMLMQWIWDHFSEGSRFDTPSGASDQAASTSSAQQPTSSRGPSSSRPKQHEGRTEAQIERDRQQKPGDAAGTVPRQEASVSLVYRSSKSPLYFQHEGHSRTIIGIERYRQKTSSIHTYNLLVLDPSIRTKTIEAKLKDGKGWQKLVKQGAAGLSKAQYQLMYVQSGLVQSEDKHNWDVMTAVETY